MINLYEGKIKYSVLDKILKPNIVSEITSDNVVSLIIDLKSFFRKIYRLASQNEEILKEDIVSEVLNLAGHFRNYFFKLNKYTDIYFLYNPVPSDLYRENFPEYKKKLYNFQHELDLPSVFTASFEMLKLISAYIPHMYTIDTSQEDDYIYSREILKTNDSKYKIIITTDDMMFPLVSLSDLIIVPKGDNSVVLNKGNVVSYLTGIDEDNVVRPDSLNLLLSMSGCKKNDIKGVQGYSYKKAYRMLSKMIRNQSMVSNEYLEIKKLKEILLDYFNPEITDIILNNYSFLNLDHFVRKNKINISDIRVRIEKMKIEKNTTVDLLNDLNAKIMRNPINLDFILKGEEIW